MKDGLWVYSCYLKYFFIVQFSFILVSHHIGHSEDSFAWTQTGNAAACPTHAFSDYASLPYVQSSDPSFPASGTISHPMVNGDVVSFVPQSEQTQPGSGLLDWGSSHQLQYSLPSDAVLDPRDASSVAGHYYHQLLEEQSYAAPVVYHFNPRMVAASSP